MFFTQFQSHTLFPDSCRQCRLDALTLTVRTHTSCKWCGAGVHGYRAERKAWKKNHNCPRR